MSKSTKELICLGWNLVFSTVVVVLLMPKANIFERYSAILGFFFLVLLVYGTFRWLWEMFRIRE